MTIKLGDRLPEATFRTMTADGPKGRSTADVFKGRKVVLFAIPGAFTPTCHRNHLPGYLANLDAIKARGVDAVAVISTNDAFVMDAWAKATGADGKIEFLSDGNADFAKAIGLEMDRSDIGFGIRTQRYSMLVDDGVVRALNTGDTPGTLDSSGAEKMLSQI